MIHFTCDACQRAIELDQESRYVVRVEVYEAFDEEPRTGNDEVDHLQEIEELIERVDDLEDSQPGEDLYKQVRYDLCSECRGRFLSNPLGKGSLHRIGFSNN